MRQIVYVMMAVFLTLMVACCGGKSALRQPLPSDTLYTGRAAMLVHGTDPERALLILDSAVIVGNLDPFTADMLRAKVYGGTLNGSRRDTAIQICQTLLQHDSASVKTDAGIRNRLVLLQVLNNAYRMQNNNEQWLRCTIEMTQLNRQQGNEVEALRTEADWGIIMANLGEVDKGLAKLDEVIRALDHPGSVDRLDACIVAMKRKISILEEQNRPTEIVPLAQRIIEKLKHFEAHQSDYADDSFRLPNIPEDRTRYIYFYRAQAYAFIAGAYAHYPQDALLSSQDSVRHYLALFDQTDFAQTSSGQSMVAPIRIMLGDYDKALEVYDQMEQNMDTDTINEDYATILRGRAVAAHARGQQEAAYDYQSRYAALKEQLHDSLMVSKAHEYAIRYQLHEKEMEIQQAEADAKVHHIIMGVVALLFVVGAVFSFYFYRRRKEIIEKNRVLMRMINHLPMEQPEDEVDEPADDETESLASEQDERLLFEQIDHAIRSERLYTLQSLQRQDIIERFGITRHTLNRLLNKYAATSSFPQYVNTFRLEEAKQLLDSKPDMTFATIAEAVGFTPANFREQFKRQYGMTPLEYRQNV